jgi:hypothetical protein
MMACDYLGYSQTAFIITWIKLNDIFMLLRGQ